MTAFEFVQLRSLDWICAVVAAPDLPDDVKLTGVTFPGRAPGAKLTGTRVQPLPEATAILRGVGLRTIERHIKVLREHGYLHRTRGAVPGKPAEYDLLGPAVFNGAARKHFSAEQIELFDQHAKQPATSTRDSGGRSPASTAPERGGQHHHQPATSTRDSGGRVDEAPAKSGGYRPPRPSVNVADTEQESNPSPPSTDHLARTPAREANDGGGGDPDHVARQVRERTGVTLDHDQVPQVDAAIGRGWTVPNLVHELTHDLAGARSPAAVIRTRLTRLGPPPPSSPTREPYDARTVCGTCGQPEDRCRRNPHAGHTFESVTDRDRRVAADRDREATA